jgi:hypothetical protein
MVANVFTIELSFVIFQVSYELKLICEALWKSLLLKPWVFTPDATESPTYIQQPRSPDIHYTIPRSCCGWGVSTSWWLRVEQRTTETYETRDSSFTKYNLKSAKFFRDTMPSAEDIRSLDPDQVLSSLSSPAAFDSNLPNRDQEHLKTQNKRPTFTRNMPHRYTTAMRRI